MNRANGCRFSLRSAAKSDQLRATISGIVSDMEKDWEARFRLSESREYGPRVWLLFPFVTCWFLATAVMILSLIRADWGKAVFLVGIGCFAVRAAYCNQGARQSLKLFCLGTGITLAGQLLLRILPPSGLWSLLVLPVFAASPVSYLLALASMDAAPGTLREQVVTEGIFALVNGFCYAAFGALFSRSRSRSAKFTWWPFTHRA